MGSLTAQALGNITSDIELRKTTGGKDFASFTVAVNHDRDNTSFVKVAVWGKTAEFVSRNFGKGDPISVAGTGKINTWEAKDGTKRTDFEIQAFNVSFVGSKRQDDRPIAQHEVLDKAYAVDRVNTKDNAPEDVDDKIDLSDIPFK